MKTFLLVIFTLLLLLSSCNDNTTQPQLLPQLDTLTGTTWKWEQYINEKGRIINVADSTLMPFIISFINDSYVTGNSGCNEYRVEYKKDSNKIDFDNYCTTKVMCKFTDIYQYSICNAYQILSATENEFIIKTNYSLCKVMYFTRND
ncbi:MAG: META domain-containing protein [Bacteroidetes bacterium]|nr:MAG: META domain-containing protein [Bacteroidota bacterium]